MPEEVHEGAVQMPQALLQRDAVHFAQEGFIFFEPRQVLRAVGIGKRGPRRLVSAFPLGKVMVVDQAAAAEGLCDELSLLPVRIDPEFVCSIHDRHPFFKNKCSYLCGYHTTESAERLLPDRYFCVPHHLFHAAAADSSRRLRSGGFLCCFMIKPEKGRNVP